MSVTKTAVLLGFLLLVYADLATAAVTRRTCPSGITKNMQISYGDYVSCQLDVVGEVAFYTFQGTAGQKIMIQVTASHNYGPCVALYAPSGTKTNETCPSIYGAYIYAEDITLAQTGTFTIRVYDSGSNETFSYALYLDRLSPPLTPLPIVYGQNLTGRIDPAAVNDMWVFAAAANDPIVVQVTSKHNYGPCVIIYAPDGKEVTSYCPSIYGSYIARFELTLAMSGTHVVRVYDSGRNEAWDYTIFLQCMGVCAGGVLNVPTLTTSLTGCTTCTAGNTFTARLKTTNAPAQQTELKLGFYVPDGTQLAVGDPHLELPPGFTFDGEILKGPITAQHQKGSWRLCGRIIELAGGDTLAVSCQSFTIQ